jgi:short-subunit dehydrogenase involved in D-alanine esterification of teichoic acids
MSGNTILVTGGSSGIGLELASRVAPQFILRQLSKSADNMLAHTKSEP